jgi:hypothetical protein
MTLHKEMEKNFSVEHAPLIFGIKVMKVAFKSYRIDFDLCDSSTTSQISLSRTSQPTCKKSGVKPSDPRDFPRAILLTITSTYSLEDGPIKIWDCFGGTNLGIALVILMIASCLFISGSERRSW